MVQERQELGEQSARLEQLLESVEARGRDAQRGQADFEAQRSELEQRRAEIELQSKHIESTRSELEAANAALAEERD
jgi:hypothetical protein